MPTTRRSAILSAAALGAHRADATAAPKQELSLAGWSFSGSFFQGKWKLLELPNILHERLKIHALEHVNQFFENPTLTYLQKLKRACSDNGVRSTILMVDNEGTTASPDKAERHQAAIGHSKWIDTAQYLGWISVRCNVYGAAKDSTQDKDLVDRAAETMRALLEY